LINTITTNTPPPFMQFFAQGTEQIKAAIANDKVQNYERALPLYINALEYLITGLKYSKNEKANQIVRSRAKEFMARAETLKAYLAEKEKKQLATSKSGSPQTRSDVSQKQPQTNDNSNNKYAGRLANQHADETLRRTLEDTIVKEKPNLSWDDVAGLDQARKTLEEAVILPNKFPQLFQGDKRKPWKGILMYGPPGTGKTHLAKVIASVANSTFFSVSSADLVSKYFGESSKLVRELFKMACDNKPAIIFIDEIDAICGQRSEGEHDATTSMKTEFLTCMNDIMDQDGVLVLAATNRPFDLDPAVRRRFEKRIYIPLPNHQARLRLLQIHLGEEARSLSKDDIEMLVARTDGFSGSDISNLCRDALMQPVRECLRAKHWKRVWVNGGDGELVEMLTPTTPDDPNAIRQDMMNLTPDTLLLPNVNPEHFTKTMQTIKSSVSKADLARYEEFTKSFGLEGTTTLENNNYFDNENEYENEYENKVEILIENGNENANVQKNDNENENENVFQENGKSRQKGKEKMLSGDEEEDEEEEEEPELKKTRRGRRDESGAPGVVGGQPPRRSSRIAAKQQKVSAMAL
jgi:vacuolar protein-sorting-associated protein 4